ncbi:polysaccharide pyruvyl transferase family protein [Rhodococcus hoagii]|nr:polysaccharide pyruvyl transferase family protein [Prescottella equi]
MRVALLHGYSSANAGDGLLVEESVVLLREALGSAVDVTLAASDPSSFEHLGIDAVKSLPGLRGYDNQYVRVLRNLDNFDLVVGVGGGYLRAGYPEEAAKMSLVHGPQLLAAARTSAPTIYLPQSVGPAKAPWNRGIGRALSQIDRFFVRDDRSLAEFGRYGATRASDLAILASNPEVATSAPERVPVVSARPVRGKVPPLVTDLCRQIRVFDGYIQSETGGNDDRQVMNSIGARRIVPRDELMLGGSARRVVVAVRLHAALMALRAGHFVIHLAYERKGFGAFEDLGLSEYVHNVNMFEPARVVQQARDLVADSAVRNRYRNQYRAAVESARSNRENLVNEIRILANRIEKAEEPRLPGSVSQGAAHVAESRRSFGATSRGRK